MDHSLGVECVIEQARLSAQEVQAPVPDHPGPVTAIVPPARTPSTRPQPPARTDPRPHAAAFPP
ncbi:MAG: hypothetical protein ACK52I_15075, partial [Pseudomonadota bacterium]